MTEISAHHAPPAVIAATEVNGARLSTLMDELRELEENNRELEEEYMKFEEKRSRVIRDIREMQQKELEDSGRDKILVGFVETVERAHQYFDCKDYLPVTFGPDKSGNDKIKPHSVLVQHLIDNNICGILSEQDVENAVRAYINEAIAELRVPERMQKFKEDYYQRLTRRSPSEYTKKDYDEINHLFRYLCLTQPEQYEMDLNPEQELQKIKMSSKDYSDSFILFLLEERRKCAKENGVVEVAEYDSSSLAKAKDKYRELLEHYSGMGNGREPTSLVRTVSQLFDAQHNA